MAREIHCPTCQKSTVFSEENPCRPFCSERCKLIDLGEWADERFRIPEENVTPDLDESENEDDYLH